MTVDLSTIEAITRLAEQFGPFLFAVLFILGITRTAHGYYRECMTRTNPPSTDQEQKTYRSYFLSSVWVGIAVMTLSIGWWFYVQTRGNYVYQITIIDLDPDELVTAQYYGLEGKRFPNAKYSTHFMIVTDRLLKGGDYLDFYYFKPEPGTAGGVPKLVRIKYTSGFSLRLHIKKDPDKGISLETAASLEPESPIFTPDQIRLASMHAENVSRGFEGTQP